MGIPHNVLNYRPTVDAYQRPVIHNSGRFNPRNDMVAGTTTAGGHVIDTELRSPIDALRSSLRVREMGATVMTGLVGDIDFPRWAQGTSPAHKAENAAADEYDPTLSKFTMSPNRLPVFTEVSNQLLIQESTDVESWLRTELGWQQAKVIDTSALTGDGTSNAPTGLTNFSGVNVVALGANGAAPTRDSLIDLETAIAEDDADEGVMGFLTTPSVKGFLKKLLVDAGSGQFVWPQGQANELEGYRALTSTNVPNDLTKGTGTALNAIFFGVWSNLMIGQWGGVDIITNPFSRDTEGLIRITFTTFYDVNFRHPEGFAIIKDADIS
jgi:HK97 family phage major capsid protein